VELALLDVLVLRVPSLLPVIAAASSSSSSSFRLGILDLTLRPQLLARGHKRVAPSRRGPAHGATRRCPSARTCCRLSKRARLLVGPELTSCCLRAARLCGPRPSPAADAPEPLSPRCGRAEIESHLAQAIRPVSAHFCAAEDGLGPLASVVASDAAQGLTARGGRSMW